MSMNQEKENQGKDTGANYKDRPVAFTMVSFSTRTDVGQIHDINSLFSIMFGY